MRKGTKYEIIFLVYLIVLAISVGSYTERVNASTDPVWVTGQQLKYRLWG